MHGTTLTLHIHRHITEDGSILLDVGKRIFRLYERSGVALEHCCGRECRRLLVSEAANLFRLIREVEAVAAQRTTAPEAPHALD